MKKLLVLGSDFGSYDVVSEAKKMGLYVFTTDLMNTSPTKEISDEAWTISTNDIDTLETKCKTENISGVMFGASDFNITCARELCKRLNLPIFCPNDYSWGVARDKSEFKKVCLKVGAPVAQEYYIDEKLKREDLSNIKYPVVIKPVDKSGNRGMSYCSNEEELIKAYKYARRVSDNSTIICEKQLHGPEWVANYVLANGDARLLYFGRELHQKNESANLYSMITTTANGLRQWNEEVNDKVIDVFKASGFSDGIAWVETMRDEDGKFYLIEPGYRFSSETSYALYENVNGFNSIRWCIETAIGIKHTSEDLPRGLDRAYKSCVASYHLFSNKEDVIESIIGYEDVNSMDNVVIDLPKRKGAKVLDHANMGLIRIFAESIDEINDKLKYINSVFSIKNKKGENMFIRFTGYEQIKEDFEEGLKEFES